VLCDVLELGLGRLAQQHIVFLLAICETSSMEGIEEPFILAPDFSQVSAFYLGQGLIRVFTEQCVWLAIGR
jgi:hypothetical protein